MWAAAYEKSLLELSQAFKELSYENCEGRQFEHKEKPRNYYHRGFFSETFFLTKARNLDRRRFLRGLRPHLGLVARWLELHFEQTF